jgi:glutaredoxin
MSEERRQRRQQRFEVAEAHPRSRKFLMAAGVVLLLAGAWGAGWYHRIHRYDAMAKCMASKQVKMYGAYWCPHCADQKEILGESYRFVYVECGVPGSHAELDQCTAQGVKVFPTWKFQDRALTPGVFSAEELSDKTGCSGP